MTTAPGFKVFSRTLALGALAAAVLTLDAIQPAVGQTEQAPSAYVDYLVDQADGFLDGDNRDPAAAAELLREAVYVGSVEAMLTLAGLYARGDGVEANFAEANKLIQGAMDAGAGGSAWVALGDLHRDFEGSERNAAAAVDAYQSGADLGDTTAMIRLAQLVSGGAGVPADFARAEKALQAAIAVGDANLSGAWANLGNLYRNAAEGDRQPAKAVAAYREALDLGYTGILVVLGEMVGRGDGVPADFEQARGYLEQAVALGDGNSTWALATLGNLYRNAAAPHRDPAKAIEAYEQALAAGDTNVLIVLAAMVGNGDGTERDFNRARKYLEQAIGLDNDNVGWAQATLGDLYRDADEKHRDLAKAVEAYQNAIDRGSVDQLVKLARLVAAGEGVPEPDFDRARTLLERAVVEDANNAAWAYSLLGDLYRNADETRRDPAAAAYAYQHAADLGDSGSMLKLARMAAAGEGIPADFGLARDLLEKAVALDDDNALWAYGQLGDLYRSGDDALRDPVKAVDAYRNALDRGNTSVLVVLGRMIGAGEGVPAPDFSAARRLLEQAVARKDDNEIRAHASLGELYERATGALRNPAKAVEAYESARALGDTSVLVPLARLIGNGDGIERDFDTAHSYLEQAIAAGGDGEVWAYAGLGDLYRNALPESRDPAKAADAYQQATDLGDTASMLKLAQMLADGDGIAVDFDRARALLETVVAAADANETAAWVRLGDLYRGGAGDQNNPAAAVAAYERAAALGNTTAMIRKAEIVGSGRGIPADVGAARALYEQAIAANDDNAVWAWTGLADLYRSAPEGDRDPAKAVEAYRKAIDLGNSGALIVLSKMVAMGDGVTADPDEAKAMLERAGASGGETAVAAWMELGALHRDPLGKYSDVDLALDYYKRAGEGGNGEAHLIAADIETSRGVTTPEQRLALVHHYREAARLIGAEPVAAAMYRLDPVTLYSTVQELLSEADRPITTDGIFGKQMQASIDRFCTANDIPSCGKGLVSFQLLIGLVSPKNPSA